MASRTPTARASIDTLSARLETTPIHAYAGKQNFVVAPNVIGFTVDREATIRNAHDGGRDKNPLQMVTDTVLRRFRPEVVPLVVHYDNARFEGLFDGWANAVRSGLVEGDLKFNGTTVVARRAARRNRVPACRRGTRMQEHVAQRDAPRPSTPDRRRAPSVDRGAVVAAAGRARAVLTGTYTVNAGATPT